MEKCKDPNPPKGWPRPIYVLHKHRARKLHYDLRLEMNGVLKSWAVPKGPPLKGEKRLAVLVEDHALGYADFEGVIEEGYGAGKVEIYDKGTFKLLEQEEGKLVFELEGEKLSGRHVLLRFKKENEKELWLWFEKGV